jgi:hypothetical protein
MRWRRRRKRQEEKLLGAQLSTSIQYSRRLAKQIACKTHSLDVVPASSLTERNSFRGRRIIAHEVVGHPVPFIRAGYFDRRVDQNRLLLFDARLAARLSGSSAAPDNGTDLFHVQVSGNIGAGDHEKSKESIHFFMRRKNEFAIGF